MRVAREASSFDRAAPGYLGHAGVQLEMARWLAEWIPAERAGSALEVGAGPGTFTERLVPWDGSLCASDLSPAMCALGRERVPSARWSVMAAESPENGPWDWIFSCSVLQWARDPAGVFAAWRRVLSPSGRILCGLFTDGSLPEWRAVAGDTAPLVWRSESSWRTLVSRAGLRIVRDGAARRTFIHPSARAFLRSLHGVGAAPHRRLGPGRLRRLLGEYQKANAEDGGVRASWRFYRFEAQR
jgi:SAM-dependent methyltransferase